MTPLSRRNFLHTGLATLAAARIAPAALADTQPAKDTALIDAHSHIWTRDVKNFPLAKGQTVADLAPPSFTDEELMAVAKPTGVNRAVLIQHHIYHGWDNSYLIHAATNSPQTFRVVGMVDDTTDRPDAAMKKLLPQRVTGFRITSLIRGAKKWLTGDGMDRMWKCAAETNQTMCCLINPEDLPGVDAMCKRHPKTKVVIDHFARVGVSGKIEEADLNNLCKLARHDRAYVKISAYYALGKKQPPYHDLIPMIRRVYDAFGPKRLMWASDCPYQLGGDHTYKASINLVKNHLDFTSEEDLEWLLRKTAEKVFFFDT